MRSNSELNTEHIVSRTDAVLRQAESLSESNAELHDRIVSVRKQLNEASGLHITEGGGKKWWLHTIIDELKVMTVQFLSGNKEQTLQVCNELDAISQLMVQQNKEVAAISASAREMCGYVKMMAEGMDELKEQNVQNRAALAASMKEMANRDAKNQKEAAERDAKNQKEIAELRETMNRMLQHFKEGKKSTGRGL